jgi:hypothetical protein
LTLDINKVIKVCSFNLLKFFKNTLIHFGFAKRFLLLGRLRKPSDQKLSCEDTYREMAENDEDWSDWDAVSSDGLDESF